MGLPPKIANSAHRWMTAGLFEEWTVAFAKWICEYRAQIFPSDPDRMAVLFLNNGRTHCSLIAPEKLAEINCKAIRFPPHLTRVLQPIDAACAGVFKATDICPSFYSYLLGSFNKLSFFCGCPTWCRSLVANSFLCSFSR
jgi:hypothetical protein